MKNRTRLVHIGFEIGLLLKGLFALGEVLCGFGMIFMNPGRVNRLITWATRDELVEDPRDRITNYLISFGHTFTVDLQHFLILYLFFHGAVKLIVILLLWKKKLWAYPLSVAVFVGFIIYQVYKYINAPSVVLLFLTFLDVAMIILTIFEYKALKIKLTPERTTTL